MFGGTTPESVTQDQESGVNDIESAKSFLTGLPYQQPDEYTKEDIQEMEYYIRDLVEDFTEKSELLEIYMFSPGLLSESFSTDILADLAWVQVSIALVSVYCIVFMGSCSPIHFRSAAAGITILCVILSYAAANGLSYMVGFKSAGIHNLLLFLLLGIGVDDMFVIAS